MSNDVESTIRTYIGKEILEGSSVEFSSDQVLFGGLLDSMALVQLVDFLEERFDIKVQPHELVDENFGSLRLLTHYVESKRNSSL
jgi:acyl carrier protein